VAFPRVLPALPYSGGKRHCGISGIILGWMINLAIGFFSGWTTSITISSVLIAFIFSASIGVIFGIYPARKASLLHPIDALRHE